MPTQLMTPTTIRTQITTTLTELLREMGLTDSSVAVSYPTQKQRGDLTTNVALTHFADFQSQTPKRFQTPIELATVLVDQLRSRLLRDTQSAIFSKIEVAGGGFINFYYSEQFLWSQSLRLINQKSIRQSLKSKRTEKVIVEFTDPNPFKVLHIGHLYSNAVGEAVSRNLEALGHTVKRACYQGDVGMHVAKTIWGWLKLSRSVTQLEKLSLDERVTFLGQAYARGAQAYKLDSSAQEEIKQLNYLVFIAAQERLQEETNWQPKVDYRQYLNQVQKFDYRQVKQLYFVGRQWSLAAFEVEYRRLGTKFDYYFYESEVGEVGFEIVQRFLAQGIFVESQGAVIFPGEKYGLHNRVFINALGLPTYEAKELGLAPTKYQRFAYDRSIIVTANEIDEYFKVLLQAMKLVLPDLADKTQHISHGMVKLTSGKMSSRTGQVITAQDLLNQLQKLAKQALDQRQGLSEAEKTVLADKVGVAAVKFAFLRSALGGDIVFNPQTAVALTGESGPYLQYSYVRTQSLWRQLRSRFGLNKRLVIDTLLSSKQGFLVDIEKKEIELLRKLNQYFDVVKRAATEVKPHLVASYLFELAQQFSQFYEQYQILPSANSSVSSSLTTVDQLPVTTQRRLMLVELVGQTLKHGLWVLGIEVVEEM